MKVTLNPSPSFNAIVGKDIYNFSLEPMKFPPNTSVKKPEVYLNYRYILQHPDPPLPLILSYQNVNRFFYKTHFTVSSAQVYYYNADHVCLLDHECMRCKICGISLKWCFMSDAYQLKLSKLEYFHSDQIDSEYILLRQIKNVTTLRKYISFVVDRPLGQGFEDMYLKHGKYPTELFTELGGLEKIQAQANDPFKILADFENSNLYAFQLIRENKDSFTIKILMRGDTNAVLNGFSQWFFFKILAKKPISLTIEIINFRKKMTNSENNKSNTLSYYDFDQDGVTKVWRFMEETVKYSKNPPLPPQTIEAEDSKAKELEVSQQPEPVLNQEWYTLKFNYTFETPKEVFFSFTFPYTFTQLIEFLARQEKKLFVKGIKEQDFDYKTKEILLENEQISYHRQVLGSTVCGLPLILLQITSSKYQDPDLYFPAKYKQKKYILIIARQHPGEPPSSFVAEGILSFLMSEDPSAQILRTFFVFLIAPMMNPDGVVLGNNRSGFKGTDFNRNWRSPDKENEPEIVLVKDFLRNLIKEGKKIAMFFDLHGHSHKMGAFVYSTPPSFLKDWEVNEDGILEWAKSSLYTNILFNNCKYLCIENCKSMFGKGKDESARMVMCKDFEIQHSYTVETSFSCYNDRKTKDAVRFKIEDFKILGKDLMMGVLEFNTILADLEYSKAGRNKNEINSELHFNKYLSKMKKSYPEFKSSWKEYFSEAQLQKMYNKLGKFVDMMNENFFPMEKEAPVKQFDVSPVANEQTLKDFYESTLFDRSVNNGMSPYEISNSSSFSSNKDIDEVNEEIMEEMEREEHKKILGMMLFHEKDLKKTEKLLKKKAMKKTLIEKQNKTIISPIKKYSSGSNKNFYQSSNKNLLFEKRTNRKTILDLEKNKSTEFTFGEKTRETKDNKSKIQEVKEYYLPPKNDRSLSNSREIRKSTTPQKLKEIAKINKDNNNNDNNDHHKSIKSSLQISTGMQFNTTASTNFGTSHSKVTTASGKRKIHDFFEENNVKQKTNNGPINLDSHIETEQSININDSQTLIKNKEKRRSKVHTTIDIAEINIPEEENEGTKRKNSWTVKARPKTATDLIKFPMKNAESREANHNNNKNQRRDFGKESECYLKNYPNDERIENSKEIKDVSDYFVGYLESAPKRIEKFFERYCQSVNRKKLPTNPFVMSKKDIYKLYSFKKPLVMVNDKRKKNFIKTFTEGSAIHNLNDETLRDRIFSEEGEKEVKSKMNQQKNKPVHILRKSFF